MPKREDTPHEQNVQEHAREEQEKAEPVHNLALLIVSGISLLIILSIAILILSFKPSPQQNVYQYGLYTFTLGPDNLYHLDYQHPVTGQRYDIPLRYLPQNVTSIPTTGMLTHLPEPIILAVSVNTTPEERGYVQLVAVDLARKLKNLYNANLTAACTLQSQHNPACENHTYYACTGNQSGIAIIPSNTTRLELKGVCATIYGSKEDLIKAEHKLLYILLGVIKQ